jgi:CheY-like chemotaxis protein
MTDTTRPSPRILVVEDEYLLADDLADGLAALGAIVIGPVGGLDEALSLLENTPEIDAALLDINLRGEMVFPLADALAVRGVPYLFATGYGHEGIPERYQRARVLEKPVQAGLALGMLTIGLEGA